MWPLLHKAWLYLAQQPVMTTLAFLCVIAALAFLYRVLCDRRLQREHEQLLQDVASLTLEKAQLEEDSLHLIEKNYKLTQRMAALRERNLSDASEENNQLFHDVALLTLEKQEIQEKNEFLQTENQNLLQTVAQLSARKPPETNEDSSQMWQNYAGLLDENEKLKNQNENLHLQRDQALRYYQHMDRSQPRNTCPVS
ncbi:uncharacterized protein ACMZJ9_021262 [Mantella aurantiaca]